MAMKTEAELREHLAHLKEEIKKYDMDCDLRVNMAIFEMIDGGITTLEWVLGDNIVRVA